MSGALPLKKRQAAVGERMPVAAVRAAAVIHPDPDMRRSCLFFLDHYDCDGSVETFRQALRDPVSFVRESALHGLACERCRYEAICVTDVVGDLIEMLASDPSPDVRHKTLVALGRFLERDTQAPEAVAKTAQSLLARRAFESRRPRNVIMYSGRRCAPKRSNTPEFRTS